jgi:hypothetical protein
MRNEAEAAVNAADAPGIEQVFFNHGRLLLGFMRICNRFIINGLPVSLSPSLQSALSF